MKKKPFWNPKEKDNHKLLVHVDERIDLIHQGLHSLYPMRHDEITANLVHGMNKQIYYLRGILFDLLFDQKPAKEILELRK